MSFFKKLFGKKSQPVNSYAAFWAWFQENAATFFPVVKRMGNIQRDFFAHVSPKLMALHEGYYLLTGMKDPETAELVFTAEGNLRNFIFVEELVAAAPEIPGWTFTAHKPAIDSIEFGVEMEGIQFDHKTLQFYPIEDSQFPDLIQIAVVHRDMNPENRSVIENGCFVFLDNYLGELRVVTEIDQVYVVAKGDAASEVMTMDKLGPYLTWRQAEFVEKYEGERQNTDAWQLRHHGSNVAKRERAHCHNQPGFAAMGPKSLASLDADRRNRLSLCTAITACPTNQPPIP